MDELLQNIRFGLRMLGKNPGFTATVILTLAVGIGANAAIFSVLNAVLLRPLPFDQPDRIVFLYGNSLTTGNVADWKEQAKSYEQFSAASLESVSLTGVADPEKLRAMLVSPDFFPLLGVRPVLGRSFLAEEFRLGDVHVAIVSQRIWREWLGSDPDAIGRTLVFDRMRYTIVGVLPPRPGPFPNDDIDVLLPLHPGRPQNTSAVARLKPGVSLRAAREEAQSIAPRLATDSARKRGEPLIQVELYKDRIVGDSRLTLLVLAGAVGFILLIACANVANLLLERVAGRSREVAVRAALGASRGRLVRQFFAESLLLSLLGAGLGLLVANWGFRSLLLLVPYRIPRLEDSRLDGSVLLFSLGLAFATAFLCGLAPALAASKLDLHQALKENTRSASGSRGRRRLHASLVVAEVALAMVMLVGAGLLLKAFFQLRPSAPGFETANRLTMRIGIPAARFALPAQQAIFFREVIDRMGTIPGVRGVAAVSDLPLSGTAMVPDISVNGQVVAGIGRSAIVHYRACTPNYLDVMGVPMIMGRGFTAADDAHAPGVAIINQTMARRFWAAQSAIGQRLTVEWPDRPMDFVIVGVVRDARIFWNISSAEPELYVPYWQDPMARMSLVVHTSGAPVRGIAVDRDAVKAVDRDAIVSDVQTLDELVSHSFLSPRFHATFLGILAGLALTLAVVGIYAVVSYSVSQRTHEIGIRMAVGAQSRNILRVVVSQAMTPVVFGIGLGIGGAVFLTRILTSLLFAVSPLDLPVYAVGAAVLIAAALLACLVPALRAARVDPIAALRCE